MKYIKHLFFEIYRRLFIAKFFTGINQLLEILYFFYFCACLFQYVSLLQIVTSVNKRVQICN